MTKPKLFLILFAICAASNYANPLLALELGNCDTPYYQKEYFANASKERLSNYLFMVEKQGAELHSSNAIPSANGGPGQTEPQDLNTILIPVAIEGKWMQVSRSSEPDKPYGWILKKDLLCAKTPLVADDGPELVFYIKTTTAPRETPETIAVYDHSSGGKKIRELSRFDSYYIMDEQDGRYLLSKAYFIDNSTKLVGWVDKDKGFIWNSAFGLRPDEELENKAVTAYAAVDTQRQYPIPILGGKHWYKIALRIPAQELQNNVYKVVLPLSGTGVCHYEGNNQVVCPQGLKTPVQNGSDSLRHVDILFLLDGTKSMQKYIEAAKHAAQVIIDQVQKDPRFKSLQFRFAFRVYRDQYAGAKEFEGLPFGRILGPPDGGLMPVDDCVQVKTKENVAAFEKTLGQVQTSSDDHDDFAENLYGGLNQALTDLRSSCTQNAKILFVIGDSGYDSDAQRRKGRVPVDIDTLRTKLLSDGKNGITAVIPFFLRTPADEIFYRGNEQYKIAYDNYRTQGNDIVQIMTVHMQEEFKRRGVNMPLSPSDFLLDINDAELIAKVKSGLLISSAPPPAALDEIKARLDGGEALVKIIKSMQGKGIPAVYFGQVLEKLCANLGKQCTEGIHDSTLPGVIDEDTKEGPKKLTLDVWFTSNSLSEYIQILNGVRKIREIQDARAKREKLTFELNKVLEAVIKKPTYVECQDASDHARECTMAEYMSRYGHLPVRAKSPLLRYNMSDLKDPTKVIDCEITALLRWVDHSYELLMVAQGNRRPTWNSEGKDPECRRADGSLVNIDIPFISTDSIRGEPFKDSAGNVDYDMLYSHKLEDKLDLYWIPEEFLP